MLITKKPSGPGVEATNKTQGLNQVVLVLAQCFGKGNGVGVTQGFNVIFNKAPGQPIVTC